MRFESSGNISVRLATAALLVLGAIPAPAAAQSVAFSEIRPFVVGIVPVVGPGGVGGVSIDAAGVVSKSDVGALDKLREARAGALRRVDSKFEAASPLRKISLRALQTAIDECRQKRLTLTGELQNLAGLTRVQFVFVYPDEHEIVLAGPAEGWTVDTQGNIVGRDSGLPVLQLDDLIVALRTAKAAASGRGISCSIDPTEEGLRRVRPLLASRGMEINEASVSRLEEALGRQQITVTGVSPGSHFARVLVAADFLMKRLGMNFERSPIDGLPSYMEMLQTSATRPPRSAMPRWWMAPKYEPLLRDIDGLAWQLRGGGVQTLTEEAFLSPSGVVKSAAKEHSLAKKWADNMTSKYEALSKAMPVFGELRNCIDLAVVAALLTKEDLPGKAGCDLSLLLDERRIAVAESHSPKTVDSRASLLLRGRDWIVSLSGGVDVDSWSVLKRVETRDELVGIRAKAATGGGERWWWD